MFRAPICPQCGSAKIRKARTRNVIQRLFWLFNRPCRCLNCYKRVSLAGYKKQPR